MFITKRKLEALLAKRSAEVIRQYADPKRCFETLLEIASTACLAKMNFKAGSEMYQTAGVMQQVAELAAEHVYTVVELNKKGLISGKSSAACSISEALPSYRAMKTVHSEHFKQCESPASFKSFEIDRILAEAEFDME